MRDPKKTLETALKEGKLSKAELEAVIHSIKKPPQEKILRHHWGTKHFKIGVGGDTHFGSKYHNQSVTKDVFKRWKKEGVEAIYLTGDITEGYNMRPGHSYECTHHGADEQVKAAIEQIPFTGIPAYFILGDHDHSHFKSAGVDVGKAIENERKDLHSGGFFSARVEFSKGTIMELVHPAKGTAYAISYQVQKMAEAMEGGTKPSILCVGHYHKFEYLFYRNIQIFQTGTLQNQTAWMRRMNLSAHLAAWTLDIYTKGDGTIDKTVQTPLIYYGVRT